MYYLHPWERFACEGFPRSTDLKLLSRYSSASTLKPQLETAVSLFLFEISQTEPLNALNRPTIPRLLGNPRRVFNVPQAPRDSKGLGPVHLRLNASPGFRHPEQITCNRRTQSHTSSSTLMP